MYKVVKITKEQLRTDKAVWNYSYKKGKELSAKYPLWEGWLNMATDTFDYSNLWFVEDEDGSYKGILITALRPCYFNPSLTMLHQVLLSGDNPKASLTLYNHLIDFGKNNADFIVTHIGDKTNIKPESLNKLGFKKLETVYMMEV